MGEDQKGMISFWNHVYFGCLGFLHAFSWKLVAPCSRVLSRDHINPRILEVLWGKTPIGEN